MSGIVLVLSNIKFIYSWKLFNLNYLPGGIQTKTLELICTSVCSSFTPPKLKLSMYSLISPLPFIFLPCLTGHLLGCKHRTDLQMITSGKPLTVPQQQPWRGSSRMRRAQAPVHLGTMGSSCQHPRAQHQVIAGAGNGD